VALGAWEKPVDWRYLAALRDSLRRSRERATPTWLAQPDGLVSLRRVGAAHAVALLTTVLVLSVNAGQPGAADTALVGLPIFLGFAVLRVASVSRPLAVSSLALDAAGTAVFLAGTNAPASPYYFLALAGAWWAGHVRRPRSGLAWAGVFAAGYFGLVGPEAVRQGLLMHALEHGGVVLILGVLADWFVRVDHRALELSEALSRAPAGAEEIAIREGLSRALGPIQISVDVLVAAGRAGLTVIQAELLAYLELGLTNQEIADATNVGEATVRYRLTRLYRVLGVHGRKDAVHRVAEFGVGPGMIHEASSPSNLDHLTSPESPVSHVSSATIGRPRTTVAVRLGQPSSGSEPRKRKH
jgi:DNA-binding CsgD family transcriptional regulator